MWCTYSAAYLMCPSLPHENAAVSAQVLCTPYSHAPCHFMQSHIRKLYVCLTCHLHFWQNSQDLLRATAVTRECNGYRNKSSQKVDTGEEILPPLLQGFEPATFRSRVRRSNHWTIPVPVWSLCSTVWCISLNTCVFGNLYTEEDGQCRGWKLKVWKSGDSYDQSVSDTRTFRKPFTKTKTFGQRASSFTGPTQWNSLPYDVRQSVSISSIKKALKTHLFKSAYN